MDPLCGAADLRRRVTDIYVSIMLLIFPLFPGFSGYANITFSKFIFFVCATVLWLAALLLLSIGKPPPPLRSHHFAALAFGLVCLLSWFFSPYRSESLVGAGRYDGLVTQLLYVAVFMGVSLFGRLRKRHLLFLGISLALCSAVAMVQLWNIDIFSLFPGDYSHYDGGIRYSGAFLGTMGNTNVLSAFCCLALPALFALITVWKSPRAWLALIPICPAVFMLIRAGVSGGFVGMGAAALIAAPLLLSDASRLRRALAAAAPLLCSAAVALAFSPEYILGEAFRWSFDFELPSFALFAAAALCLIPALILGKSGFAPSPKTLRRGLSLACAAVLVLCLVFVYFSPAEDGTVYELSQVMHGNWNEKFGSSRILIWRESLSLFPERPLLGSGPDTLALRVDVQFSRLVEETGQTLRSGVDNAHNEYIGYLINTGLLGLTAYAAVLLLSLAAWLRRRHRHAHAALGTGVLCYCVQSFFALGLPLVAPMFWIALALLSADDTAPHELCKPESEIEVLP